jgi:predicted acyltransferase
VKGLWTPAWVLFSGGLCFLGMAAFYSVMDVRGSRFWAFPLTVLGVNSIAVYCLSNLVRLTFETRFTKLANHRADGYTSARFKSNLLCVVGHE